MNYFYFFVDLGAVIVPLLFSFHPRLQFYKQWKAILPALLLPLIIFLPWDMVFTTRGVWGFNSKYISGFNIYNLPLEEVLFFICIPYACLFTYYCITKVLNESIVAKVPAAMYFLPPVFLIIIAIVFYNRSYTFSTALLLGCSLLVGAFFFRQQLKSFYLVYAILLIPFFIVNGLLTGTGIDSEVVWYNNSENLNLRLLTIPVEDVFYGMLLVLLNVYCFEWFSRKQTNIK